MCHDGLSPWWGVVLRVRDSGGRPFRVPIFCLGRVAEGGISAVLSRRLRVLFRQAGA